MRQPTVSIITAPADRPAQKPLSSSRRMPARRQEQGATPSTVCSLLLTKLEHGVLANFLLTIASKR